MPLRLAVLCCLLPAVAGAETLTLPEARRPAWLADEGIVMAGSWEPLAVSRSPRRRQAITRPLRNKRKPTSREHSPAMLDRLQALGVNFVMLHCYKGGGLLVERESMADAVALRPLVPLSAACGWACIPSSGTMMWDLLFAEAPQARDWVVRDQQGQPRTYGKAAYRYYWNRNDPAAAAYHQQLVRFAVEEIKTDLVHLDNYHVGPGSEPVSVQRFRRFMARTFTPAELRQAGLPDLESLGMPTAASPPLWRRRLGRLRLPIAGRFLPRPDALRPFVAGRHSHGVQPRRAGTENHPAGGPRPAADRRRGRVGRGGGVGLRPRPAPQPHPQLQDRPAPGEHHLLLTLTPLEMAEAMAFNRDTLGAVCWFEYDQITARPGLTTSVATEALRPFIDFFHRRRELLRGAEVVADVAVLRSFSSRFSARPRPPR